MEIIGKRITELREGRGLTRARAARGIRMSLAAYARWEKGIAMRGVENLVKIAKFYSVTTDYLVGLAENKS